MGLCPIFFAFFVYLHVYEPTLERRKMKAIVLFSGGIDSSTCLAMAIKSFGRENVITLTISYGQKHMKEIEASKSIVEYYGVENITINLSSIFKMSNCSLL